ncbi:hypothetical protein SCANM124S_04694 [Streptomyces canus]
MSLTPREQQHYREANSDSEACHDRFTDHQKPGADEDERDQRRPQAERKRPPMMYDQSRAQQPASQPRGGERRTAGPDPLLPSTERDAIAVRLGHALNTFADTPLEALEEAESAFDEATAQLANALAERRRVLRAGWQDQDPEAQSDELRHALRQYREITQRLLHL